MNYTKYFPITREVICWKCWYWWKSIQFRISAHTTTNTMDTEATVNESIRMINAGCELALNTCPSRRGLENLQNMCRNH